jgi:class 3 adenylate cyclase/tetratricopeptide (TPR) repeat protein
MSESLSQWLKTNDLAELEAVFVENQVDLKTLAVLTEADLKELQISFGPRKRLLNAIAEGKQLAAAKRAESDTKAFAIAGERRQLTVMFCDLVGSTALAAEMDPEELHRLISSYTAACAEVVLRYQGHVAKHLGDGVMVFFGWPVAQEDAVERGVRSALEIVQAIKAMRASKPLAVRIGLATGGVIVGEVSPGKADAVGETPNLAARLQALAGPDEVIIAPLTRRLVADAFKVTDLGPHPLKGFPQPVRVWRVDEAKPGGGRFAAFHAAGKPARLIGRDAEKDLLAGCWQRAGSGAGEVVLIGGEAGIGKSRLTQEICEGATEAHTTLFFQCSPFHLNSPLYPFIKELELSADFARDDTPAQRLDKLEAALAVARNESAEMVPLLAALLSLPTERYPERQLSPRKRKEETLLALALRIEALAQRAPVLMVVEDIHWIDPTSQELLELLVPRVRARPVLLVLTHRPEYQPEWMGQDGVTTLALNRLARQVGAGIVETLTEGRKLPPQVLEELLARADGVPLFVEELTLSLLESGQLREEGGQYVLPGPLVGLSIPASLRDLLMARLDRLGPGKEFAQIGACIGREFSCELLARVSELRPESVEQSLATLVDSGLVTRRPSPESTLYTFKHALIQDAAYDSLLKTRRSELHGRIAKVLETDFAELVSQAPEWLAHHQSQAGWLQAAIPWWRKAGVMAVGRVAMKEAIAHFQKGLTLIDQLPSSRERDRLELSIREPLNAAWTGLKGWAAAEVGQNANAILRLARSQDNPRSLLLAMWWVWTSTITQGRIADSLTWVQQLLEERKDEGQVDIELQMLGNATKPSDPAGGNTRDVDLEMFGHATAMVQHFLSGQLVEARAETDRALTVFDEQQAERWVQLTGHDMRTFVQVYACQLLWVLGFPEQARQLSDQARANAQAAGHAFNLVWALTFSAYVFAYRREPDPFLERVEEADRLAREQGLAFISEVSVPQARGIAALQQGRRREGMDLLRQGIERWTKAGGNVRVPFLKSALADAEAAEGNTDAALRLIEECLEQIERPSGQERLWLAEVLRIKGRILIAQGREPEAEAVLREAIACARRQMARSWELRATTTLAGHSAGTHL